ncbi:hypothetical protein GCM10027020_30380 [Nocardioides salsibiostraticola]
MGTIKVREFITLDGDIGVPTFTFDFPSPLCALPATFTLTHAEKFDNGVLHLSYAS